MHVVLLVITFETKDRMVTCIIWESGTCAHHKIFDFLSYGSAIFRESSFKEVVHYFILELVLVLIIE